MSISSEKEALIGRVFETYLTEYHHDDILQLLAEANEENHHPLIVNAMTLFETNMEVGDYFNAYPHDVLAIFDKVLHRTAMTLSQDTSLNHSSGQRAREQRMRQTFHARITGLPVCPELTRDTIPRSRDVGHFLSVTGTVIRTSVAKVLEYERDYMCSKCRHVFTMQADFDQFYTFVPPLTCPNPDGCNSFKFTCLSDGSGPAACRDYQEIKIQEQAQRLLVGSIPRSMVVVLEDDLVDTCKSGDDVTVYGVMCQRWRPFYDNTRCDVELVLKANNIEVNNQQAASALLMKDVQQEFEDFWKSYEHDPIAGRNQILLSLCPQVFGMYVIKLAVAMVLAGGVQRIDSSGTKIRGECHMLLVGDPGTGKSQFLKYAAKIMPRSVLTAGIGSTSAGLTVAAVKDGGDWHLEAGALVLSDGGLCCIDEFNSIKEHDRISIHEAMEQQSISVAKAGMVCKLNTRSTILAAANPKGQYDPNEPLSVNVALPSPLLSRFDLVLVLLDTRNTEWDRIISSFILEDRGLPSDSSSLWSMEKMKAYFSVIRQLQPQVSEEANSILTRYYQMQRQRDGRNAARTTIRMLESLSRLAEAHARLMYRQTVTIEDAVTAVSVMECSMQGGALLGNVNALLTSFPAEPSQQYQTQCQVLLEGLNLPLLLHKEMDRLARLKSSTEASQFDPLPDNHQHQLTDTNTINIPSYLDVNSEGSGHVSRESGLDWFHSITPSVSPDDQTSPIITSTQLNSTRKPNWSNMSALDKQLNCQSEKDIDSALNHDGTVTSASEGLNRNDCDRQKDQQRPRSSRFVFQKVSKNVRGRRLRELEMNNQQCDGDEAGRHGESVVSTGLPAKNVTDVLNRTSDSHSSSTVLSAKTRPLNKLAQENQSSDKRNQTRTKTISAVLGEKMAAETDTGKSLHTQLSDFIFKPKQMRPLLHDVSVELHSECNPGNSEFGPHTGSNASKEKSHGPDEAITETKQNEHQHNQKEENRRKQLSSISEVGEGGSDNSRGLETNVFSPPKDSLVNRKRKDKENLCKQQRTRLSTADEVIVDDFTGTTPVRSNLPISESASGHMKSTVASIARAKLSQFSFTCTSEPTTTAQTRKEDNPPEVVEKGSLRSLTKATAETLRANPEVKKSVCHEHGTGKTSVAPPGQGQGTEQNVMNWSPVHCENTVNLKKRKCFELGPPPAGTTGFRGGFSGLSLFNSVELSNDVFDTDWDQELPKKAKV